MNSEYSIYTVRINPEYKDFANTLMAVMVILLVLHLLMAGQKSTGLIGSLFNSPFSETFSKILIAISFYYLVFRKMVTVV
jgi:hypothetical protein